MENQANTIPFKQLSLAALTFMATIILAYSSMWG